MKTTRVRIAIAINTHGEWNAIGYVTTDGMLQVEANWDDDPEVTFHWVEADIPIPEPKPGTTVVEGEVS